MKIQKLKTGITCHEVAEPKKCNELNVLTSYRLNDFKRRVAFTLAEVPTMKKHGQRHKTCSQNAQKSQHAR